LPELRLYYVRVGFLASAYINQVGEEPATVLPANLADPLCRACRLLRRPPILSYDGYATTGSDFARISRSRLAISTPSRISCTSMTNTGSF
jgi:hypothetical protein